MATISETMKKTHVRYLILFLIFIVTTFNYVDRATLSIAAPAMRKELGFDAITMGFAFSAFIVGPLKRLELGERADGTKVEHE